jgi:hypothetical protein
MPPPFLGPKSKFFYYPEDNRKPVPPKRLYLSTNVHEVLSQIKNYILFIILIPHRNKRKKGCTFSNTYYNTGNTVVPTSEFCAAAMMFLLRVGY